MRKVLHDARCKLLTFGCVAAIEVGSQQFFKTSDDVEHLLQRLELKHRQDRTEDLVMQDSVFGSDLMD